MKKRRIFSVFCISLLIFTSLLFSGCSSFDESGLKNGFNNYYDWYNETFSEDVKEPEKEDFDKEFEEINYPQTDASSNNHANFVLSKEKIVF